MCLNGTHDKSTNIAKRNGQRSISSQIKIWTKNLCLYAILPCVHSGKHNQYGKSEFFKLSVSLVSKDQISMSSWFKTKIYWQLHNDKFRFDYRLQVSGKIVWWGLFLLSGCVYCFNDRCIRVHIFLLHCCYTCSRHLSKDTKSPNFGQWGAKLTLGPPNLLLIELT